MGHAFFFRGQSSNKTAKKKGEKVLAFYSRYTQPLGGAKYDSTLPPKGK